MKFGLISDLHLDFKDVPDSMFSWRGDVLVLAGDIAEDDYYKNHLEPFFDKISKMANTVVLIRGNHESYNSEIDESGDHIERFIQQWNNIVFLEDSSLTNLPVDIWGSTFWTDFGKRPDVVFGAEAVMNDYRKIRVARYDYRSLRGTDVLKYHEDSKASLTKFLNSREDSSKPVVVVTHHAPSSLSIHPKYMDDNEMNMLYYSDQSEVMLDHPEIKAWCHGHVHSSFDYQIGETRVLCNPRGYPYEIGDWIRNDYAVKEFEIST
jgi:Icc-related predicted phosphoesterase